MTIASIIGAAYKYDFYLTKQHQKKNDIQLGYLRIKHCLWIV